MPSFILIRPTVWPQYTNVKDRTGQTDRQTDRETNRQTGNGLIAKGEPFYKRSPKNYMTKLHAILCPHVLPVFWWTTRGVARQRKNDANRAYTQ